MYSLISYKKIPSGFDLKPEGILLIRSFLKNLAKFK